MVTEIQPGKLVKVEPDALDAKDVIELAEVLIEEHGWVQGSGGDQASGWSIHGAIGEAARRATGAGAKDYGDAPSFRNQAAVLVTGADPLGRTEMEINDQAQTVDEALAVMRKARGAV